MWLPFRRKIPLGESRLFTPDDAALLRSLRREASAGFVLVAADIDPTSADERDGYVQRVKAIDEALAPRSRVYLIFHPAGSRQPTYTALGNGLWRIEIAERDPVGIAALLRLASRSRGLYIHSVYRLTSPMLRHLMSLHSTPCVFDVHGAVPEECEMSDDKPLADLFGPLEKEACQRADRIVCVSPEMSAHLARKYGPPQHPHILCPVFVPVDAFPMPIKEHREKPTIIYAGGTQVWQKVPQMLDLVAATKELFNFIFMIPNVSDVTSGLMTRGVDLRSANVTVSSGSRNEVFARYGQSDFGLILRDDHIVNRVSCPTKLIEYLHFGIVPIVETESIGGLIEFGIKCIHVDQIANGPIPDYNGRRQMALANRQALQAILKLSSKGRAELNAVFVGERHDH